MYSDCQLLPLSKVSYQSAISRPRCHINFKEVELSIDYSSSPITVSEYKGHCVVLRHGFLNRNFRYLNEESGAVYSVKVDALGAKLTDDNFEVMDLNYANRYCTERNLVILYTINNTKFYPSVEVVKKDFQHETIYNIVLYDLCGNLVEYEIFKAFPISTSLYIYPKGQSKDIILKYKADTCGNGNIVQYSYLSKGVDSNDLNYSKLNRPNLNYINKYILERYDILRRDFKLVNEDGIIKYKVNIKTLSAKYHNQEEEAELTSKNIKYSLKNIRWDILLNSPTTPEIKEIESGCNFRVYSEIGK
ncbi:hypothetical protein K502DRAFT_365981 [Neoconidiobolus thromboides FSU 785]|nr:hypothetical protein K502DRAFT_365981 [Neoconidiobolus thromboides FSU 785]